MVYGIDGSTFSIAKTPKGWFHLVLNHKCEETTVYVDGVQANTHSEWTEFKNKMQPGDGRVVIGKCFKNANGRFGGVKVDELTFWNHILTSQEIPAIYNMHQ